MEHLWEIIQQLPLWIALLLDRGNLEVSSIENLITVCRLALERIGRRECLDPAFAWLAACKNSLIHLGGVPFDQICLSIQDVYTPPGMFRTLSAYWLCGTEPPQLQILWAIQTLKSLKERQMENRRVVRMLNEMLLLAEDILQSKPHPASSVVPFELAPKALDCNPARYSTGGIRASLSSSNIYLSDIFLINQAAVNR